MMVASDATIRVVCGVLETPAALRAVALGDADVFERLVLAHSPDARQATSLTLLTGPNELPLDKHGAGLVHYAALAGNVDWLKRCRECEIAWTPVAPGGGRTIAHYATMSGSTTALEWIAGELGEDFVSRPRASDGATIAMIAAIGNIVGIFEWLHARYGAESLALPSSDGLTPVHVAAANGSMECLRYLVDQLGVARTLALPDIVDALPIMYAGREGQLAVIEFIHAEYVKTDVVAAERIGLIASTRGQPAPLCGAATGGHVDVLRFVVDKYGPVELLKKRPGGYSLAHAAAEAGRVDVLNYLASMEETSRLLTAKAIPGHRTPCDAAARNGQVDALRCIVRALTDEDGVHGANEVLRSAADTWTGHLAHGAAEGGHVAVLEYLAEQLDEAYMLKPMRGNLDVLDLAARGGHVAAVEYLLGRFPQLQQRRPLASMMRAPQGAMGLLRLLVRREAAPVLC